MAYSSIWLQRLKEQSNRQGELLLRLCFPVWDTQDVDTVNNLINSGSIDWISFTQNAVGHGLLPALGRHLESSAVVGLPAQTKEEILDLLRLSNAQSLRLTGEMMRIQEAMKVSGVKLWAYKGPVLSQSLYGDVGGRQFDDLDFFVSSKDLITARECMNGLGYSEQLPLSGKCLRAYIKEECEYNFKHKESGISVELHWNGLPGRFGIYLNLDTLRVAEDNFNSSENNVLLLCAHHGLKHSWERLSWYEDLYTLLHKPGIKWHSLAFKAQQLCLKHVLFLGLKHIEAATGWSSPLLKGTMCAERNPNSRSSALLERSRIAGSVLMPVNFLYDKMIQKSFDQCFSSNPRVPTPMFEIRRRLSLLGENKLKFKFIMSLLRPGAYDWQYCKLPDIFYFLYYFIRPWRLLVKASKASKACNSLSRK